MMMSKASRVRFQLSGSLYHSSGKKRTASGLKTNYLKDMFLTFPLKGE